jgi:hypothetical protein
MYVSHQMLRVNHDEWLRYAETRRLISEARAASRGSARASGRRPFRRSPFRLSRQLRQA